MNLSLIIGLEEAKLDRQSLVVYHLRCWEGCAKGGMVLDRLGGFVIGDNNGHIKLDVKGFNFEWFMSLILTND